MEIGEVGINRRGVHHSFNYGYQYLCTIRKPTLALSQSDPTNHWSALVPLSRTVCFNHGTKKDVPNTINTGLIGCAINHFIQAGPSRELYRFILAGPSG